MPGGENKSVHIVAVNMGYGHERPARVLRSVLQEKEVILANDYIGIPKGDRAIWQQSRVWYERISRFRPVTFWNTDIIIC